MDGPKKEDGIFFQPQKTQNIFRKGPHQALTPAPSLRHYARRSFTPFCGQGENPALWGGLILNPNP